MSQQILEHPLVTQHELKFSFHCLFFFLTTTNNNKKKMSVKKYSVNQNHFDRHQAQIPTPCSEDVDCHGGSAPIEYDPKDEVEGVNGLDTPCKDAQGTDRHDGHEAVLPQRQDVQRGAPGSDRLDVTMAVLPQYHSVKARLQTFDGWPVDGAVSPRDLVLAGFLYTGKGDSVQCFYCGVMLKNWGSHDLPWETHALFRFSCDYIRAVKGEQFVTDTLCSRARAGVGDDNPNAANALTEANAPASSDSPDGRSRSLTISYATTYGDMSSIATPHAAGDSLDRESSRRVGNTSGATVNPNQSSTNGNNREGSTAAPKGEGTPSALSSVPAGVPGATLADSGTCAAPVASSKTGPNPQENQLSSAPLMTDSAGSTVSREFPAPARHSGSSTSSVPASNSDDIEARFRRLQQTNQRLRQQSTCRLCGLRPVDTIFLPCGHLVTCDSCASSIRSCCLCREHIRATAHVYLE